MPDADVGALGLEPALLRSERAAPPRTLVDIFRDVVQAHPSSRALDNGAEVLTYAEFEEAADEVADSLRTFGVGRGDRVGVRIKSGTLDLYVGIMGILLAGAAYVPVDADDPDERARLIFDEADVAAILGNGLRVTPRRHDRHASTSSPVSPSDDAWIIFTSGSTGTPKGVAVSHRSAAAFVDAESRIFLQGAALGPEDRVMAGLSVAFDASCEEMWLAWGHGGCLVPAPRSLVRSGVDVGPWIVANDITVVSTVPTLVSLWPTEALARVRLLIMGGEACPPEIGARLALPGREVWNTYGPTEATVVACGAEISRDGPVRIGLPLDGWDLAVVDADGVPVSAGQPGELIIGGVGLARYLDPAKEAEKYAPMPTLGWDRAYRSGDIVRFDGTGLVFAGRADDQIKLGGRRIELGEIDSALLGLPGVAGAAAAVRTSQAGNQILIGYINVSEDFDTTAATEQLRRDLPAALVPRLAQVDQLPTRTSGKIDREALPWPLPGAGDAGVADVAADLTDTERHVADLWLEVLGAVVRSSKDDFFDLGGGSLTAAQLVSRLRASHPDITVADVYEQPSVKRLADLLDTMDTPVAATNRRVRPTPWKTQMGQVVFTVPLRLLSGLRWATWVLAGSNVAAAAGATWAPTTPWAWLVAGWVLLVLAPGRMALSALGARILMHGIRPGDYPRGGRIHLRVWLAERLADELGAANLAGAAWMPWYARALGAKVGRDVDLHSLPPVTGMLTLGRGCSIEPEVDLAGYWVDGDVLRIGHVKVGAGARVGTRSTLGPGATLGRGSEVAPGSAVLGRVPKHAFWSGSPAEPVTRTARGPWSAKRPRRMPRWTIAYALLGLAVSLLPVVAGAVAALVLWRPVVGASSLRDAWLAGLAWSPVAVVAAYTALAVLVLATVRLLSLGLGPGHFPIHSRPAWQAWGTMRVLDEARTWLFPIYASALTPGWLRALGARIGKHVEASTVLLIPRLTSVSDQSFLADDTLIGSYELGGGWLRVERVKIGKRAFVGNSGMAAPGRKVPKRALVAVLSAAPRRKSAKAGASWLGSPPVPLRRSAGGIDASRTYQPARHLQVARACVELCRVVPMVVGAAIGWSVVAAILVIADALDSAVAAALSGVVLMAAGAVAAAVTVLAKWVLVGRIAATDHPLWSSFVWRNELVDNFVEVVAAPWFARAASGTPVLNFWLRLLGVKVGRGVWCETYWLPESDQVRLADGATVNRGCVVQTHLFHDRVLSIDAVTLHEGATLGANSVILPASSLGRHATVGPVSLVMRGESVPDKTRWMGNPIGPWVDEPGRSDA
ncbi:Pls/PosA family non-ribosomal peptide synthetase [Nocardioides iriomotensis]|uniref:Amino acid adenylation domain-containing protein n=1 Tax=Nocardioides iriomotensis TaxID=715784 RepID=A0A4Q5JBA5_9ACTN|nr:Pls/PosA family non-ribosomal peptide synthetase [Nocardioides iriomotensis]RYU15115.1 amino acid adenylation domain-containing protein [Nocardioides iriomotensis]